jgi:hypothetical protein
VSTGFVGVEHGVTSASRGAAVALRARRCARVPRAMGVAMTLKGRCQGVAARLPRQLARRRQHDRARPAPRPALWGTACVRPAPRPALGGAVPRGQRQARSCCIAVHGSTSRPISRPAPDHRSASTPIAPTDPSYCVIHHHYYRAAWELMTRSRKSEFRTPNGV